MFHNIWAGDLKDGELRMYVSEGFRVGVGWMRRKTCGWGRNAVCKIRQGNTTQIKSIIFLEKVYYIRRCYIWRYNQRLM